MIVDEDPKAGDCAGGDDGIESPAARPEVDDGRTEDLAGGEDDVKSPAARSEPDSEVEQAPGDAHASRPVSPWPDPQTANPAPRFTRTFPNVKEFLAFAKAEFKQQEPSSSSWEEAVRAREERVVVEEELLHARELRLTNQHE